MAEYTDLTISLRLSDACIRSESRYEWIADSESGTWEIRGIDFYDLFEGPAYCAGQLSYAAYSEEELLFMLPSDIMNRIRMKGKIWIYNNEASDIRLRADNKINLLAELLLYLRKQGL